MSAKNKIIISIVVVVFILAFLVFSTIRSINKYVDTHTWATVHVTGESNSIASDSFDYEYEYLKGDIIDIGNVKLYITDISTNGTVTFSVQQGYLYNEAGKTIDEDTIFKASKSNYKLNNGIVSLTVTDNRYQ